MGRAIILYGAGIPLQQFFENSFGEQIESADSRQSTGSGSTGRFQSSAIIFSRISSGGIARVKWPRRIDLKSNIKNTHAIL